MTPVMTFLKDSDPSNGDAALNVAGGWVPLGGAVNMTAAEIAALQAEGVVLLPGPAVSPGAPVLGTFAVAAGAAGLPNGTYRYVLTYVTGAGETLPSVELSGIVLTTVKGSLSNIPLGPIGVIDRKIYRTIAGGAAGTEKLVGNVGDNVTTIFTDNIADGSLGAVVPTADTSANAALVATAAAQFGWRVPAAGVTSAGAEGL